MTVRVLIGHVLDRLAELPDESVHCVVTSPPYYGLRDYGIEPQVWGGSQSTAALMCQDGHDWGDEAIITKSGGTGKSTLMNDGRPDDVRQRIASGTVEAISFKSSTGAFCLRCGAWRGSLGLEPTPALYIEHMVAVFREVKRVLRKDGTLWLNIGDSYAGGGNYRGVNSEETLSAKQRSNGGARGVSQLLGAKNTPGCKPKDLLGIPWALAFALRDDGWYLRSEITWAKRAPMPESCTDRPTTATEKVFLLTKSGSPTYWTHRDHEGTRTKPAPDYRWRRLRDSRQDRVTLGEVEYETAEEPPEWRNDREHWRRINLWDAHNYFYDAEAVKEAFETDPKENYPNRAGILGRGMQPSSQAPLGADRRDNTGGYPPNGSGRNMRNWWLLGPEPFPEAHFATFVTEIPRRAILAGTSERGVCPKCGAGWERVVAQEKRAGSSPTRNDAASRRSEGNNDRKDAENGRSHTVSETIGWLPTCSCNASAAVPATCLDPFLGAGTTALVADRLNRHCIGIELNPQYAAMAENRIRRDAPLFADIAAE